MPFPGFPGSAPSQVLISCSLWSSKYTSVMSQAATSRGLPAVGSRFSRSQMSSADTTDAAPQVTYAPWEKPGNSEGLSVAGAGVGAATAGEDDGTASGEPSFRAMASF